MTVSVTPLPETSLSSDESYITISDALTASEIIKLYSKREATISVALSTDLYQIMSFRFIGSMYVNGYRALGDYNDDKIYTCETMTADIIQISTSWNYFYLDYANSMNASNLNPFYYCMATSTHRASDGYEQYIFYHPVDMDGLLDSAVLTSMANAS